MMWKFRKLHLAFFVACLAGAIGEGEGEGEGGARKVRGGGNSQTDETFLGYTISLKWPENDSVERRKGSSKLLFLFYVYIFAGYDEIFGFRS